MHTHTLCKRSPLHLGMIRIRAVFENVCTYALHTTSLRARYSPSTLRQKLVVNQPDG